MGKQTTSNRGNNEGGGCCLYLEQRGKPAHKTCEIPMPSSYLIMRASHAETQNSQHWRDKHEGKWFFLVSEIF